MSERWSAEGPQVTESFVDTLEAIIDDETDLIVEHRFYRGSRAPYRFVAQSFEDLRRYIRERTHPGDGLVFWKWVSVCSHDAEWFFGKVPNADGNTPVGGAY